MPPAEFESFAITNLKPLIPNPKLMKATQPKMLMLALLLLSAMQVSAFYDPNLQRWPNGDPKRNRSGGVNLYEFARNAGVNRVDPFGLDSYLTTTEGGLSGHHGIGIDTWEWQEDISGEGNWVKTGTAYFDFTVHQPRWTLAALSILCPVPGTILDTSDLSEYKHSIVNTYPTTPIDDIMLLDQVLNEKDECPMYSIHSWNCNDWAKDKVEPGSMDWLKEGWRMFGEINQLGP